jgi:hypothetical protein
MFPSLLFSIALNRGLEPYGDDEEFYVGVIVHVGGNSLCIQFSDKKGKHSYRKKRFAHSVFVGHKKACPARGGTGFRTALTVIRDTAPTTHAPHAGMHPRVPDRLPA